MKRRRMKLPNGFGQITKISNQRLRKPYRAMITVGHTEEGKPICKLLKPESYFETYNDAYKALVKYNENPNEMKPDVTMQEVFDKWFEEKSNDGTSGSSLRDATSTWKYCGYIWDMKPSEVKEYHIKECIDKAKIERHGIVKYATPGIKKRMKQTLNMVLDYAVLYDLAEHNVARGYRISKRVLEAAEHPDDAHIAFSEEELEILWKHTDNFAVECILISCYSGWRPGELVILRKEDVNIDEKVMHGGIKTRAGKNRIVPIHSKVLQLVKDLYDNSTGELLLGGISYNDYLWKFKEAMMELGLSLKHKPHDCRKTFVTRAKKYHMDEYAIKRIAGHAIADVTEKIYTERSIGWLASEIEKLE